MLQPFTVADATLDWYRRYVRTSFPLHDPALDAQREKLIEQGLLWTEPNVALARPGTQGPELAALNLLRQQTRRLPWGFTRLYAHQDAAIRRLSPTRQDGPQDTLVLSGTGSGKTESFLIPIIDACLGRPGPGVKAVLVYPMNALANDQLKRLQHLLKNTPQVTYGRYTGDTPEYDAGDSRRPGRPDDAPPNLRWSRDAMRKDPPNILLTNHYMLELLLVRGRDEELFRKREPVHGSADSTPLYLVVDEIHLYSGVLGAEVAALLRRFRQRVARAGREVCVVGTSATAGEEGGEEEQRLLSFAGRFFATRFDSEALIRERPEPWRTIGPLVPASPHITDELLRDARDHTGLAALAKATFGLDLPDDRFPERLGESIDQFATVGVVERALERPAPLHTVADALVELPERRGTDREVLLREAQAIVLLGAAARVQPVGEEEPQPRFRPRVHQVLRSIAGLWRCLDPAHGALLPPHGKRCSCECMALPLASCRTCGEAFWASPADSDDFRRIGQARPLEPGREARTLFLADPKRLRELIDTFEDGATVRWQRVRLCVRCGVLARNSELAHLSWCPDPQDDGVPFLASLDKAHCPACGSQGARNRPVVLPLHGSAAASVAVLTQGLSDELRETTGEAGGRLLVFADSRQDAAQQAGYSDDQGARIATRQLIASALGSGGPRTLAAVAKTVVERVLSDPETLRRWLVGESRRDFGEVADGDYLPSGEDEQRIRQQLRWEVALEVTERARRRFSLEQEGVITVEVEGLEAIAAKTAEGWPSNPFRPEQAWQVIAAVVDMLRYSRAVWHDLLLREPKALVRNHELRIGDHAVTATVGFGAAKFTAPGIEIRAWTLPKNQTRATELLGRVLAGSMPLDGVNRVVRELVDRLAAVGLLRQHNIEGRKRLLLDHERILLTRRGDHPLWRCDRCGLVRSSPLTNLDGGLACVNWRCRGTPRPFTPDPDRDFYRNQYLTEPRRLIVREHSGQIPGDTRLALEAAFNDPERPVIDALACTPTLEVGVSLDDLHGVLLRNLPPTPANYAQRVGRAGRRSKVALAFAHAGQSPHDSYFFERPGDLIAGQVRAPAISLDNQPLLRRHINALIMEILGVDLPDQWVPREEVAEVQVTVADSDGVLLQRNTLQPFTDKLADPAVKERVRAAVQAAFAAPDDPAPPSYASDLCEQQIEQFTQALGDALERWCVRYRALWNEYRTARSISRPNKQERDLERRLLSELERLAEPRTPEYRPLGFLSLVGFLPRYGSTGETVLLHTPGAEVPVAQTAHVAVTEYAPANIVYARGRRLKVRNLDPVPVDEGSIGAEHRDNVVMHGRRCDACEYLTADPLVKACPDCGDDLVGQIALKFTGVYASGGAISSEDEYRRREDYDIHHLLGPAPATSALLNLGGYDLEWRRGQQITVANTGLSPEDNERPRGFQICMGCGYAAEAATHQDDDDEPTGHAAFCPLRRDAAAAPELIKPSVWLIATLQGDVMEIVVPESMREDDAAEWRVTLAEALLLGIRETMQADRRDLGWFERLRKDKPVSLVLYDTMPGGTGYIPNLFVDGARRFKEAAREAARRLTSCDCASSCHRCLRDFWNQRHHEMLNRFEVIGPLQRLAEAEPLEGPEAEDARLESFLEREFYARLRAANLPMPTLQITRQVGERRILRVDCEYRGPDISIFLDGRTYHTQSPARIASDLERRSLLEAKGVCVLEYTYHDVMDNFDRVATEIRRALDGPAEDPALDIESLPGWTVLSVDQEARLATLTVKPRAWMKDETTRREALRSANQARLAGWRLNRRAEDRPG